MPVRNVSNRGGSVIGRFPSIKMERMIAFESLLERDFIYLLDYDARVEWFEEQPLTIEYEHEAQTLHYTSDFHVIGAGQQVVVECKPERFVETPDNQRKFAVARAWCVARGWEFRVVTDQQIRAGHRLSNIKRLTQYARLSLDPVFRYRVNVVLQDAPNPLTLQALAQAIEATDPDRAMAGLLHLAFHHQLNLALDLAPLSGQTLVAGRRPVPQAVQP
jgi:hypothetical protein